MTNSYPEQVRQAADYISLGWADKDCPVSVREILANVLVDPFSDALYMDFYNMLPVDLMGYIEEMLIQNTPDVLFTEGQNYGEDSPNDLMKKNARACSYISMGIMGNDINKTIEIDRYDAKESRLYQITANGVVYSGRYLSDFGIPFAALAATLYLYADCLENGDVNE